MPCMDSARHAGACLAWCVLEHKALPRIRSPALYGWALVGDQQVPSCLGSDHALASKHNFIILFFGMYI